MSGLSRQQYVQQPQMMLQPEQQLQAAQQQPQIESQVQRIQQYSMAQQVQTEQQQPSLGQQMYMQSQSMSQSYPIQQSHIQITYQKQAAQQSCCYSCCCSRPRILSNQMHSVNFKLGICMLIVGVTSLYIINGALATAAIRNKTNIHLNIPAVQFYNQPEVALPPRLMQAGTAYPSPVYRKDEQITPTAYNPGNVEAMSKPIPQELPQYSSVVNR
ncbi:uncharacterized protein TRIADDRAFT_61179 [Trichoplax adhaerens]|uniref:Uncharacterized protein n=1 Tax=Trichoplax adhaerens TaxID=10228 RepID=B3SA91_TRIAD|nr:predicted protein [Trichoplax adhaerens]EDV20398.1 predicted protein [Trichoplax adhaerens]|eukprot:XP_002117092.1 predicted protein [Trichoplax adhaerens]